MAITSSSPPIESHQVAKFMFSSCKFQIRLTRNPKSLKFFKHLIDKYDPFIKKHAINEFQRKSAICHNNSGRRQRTGDYLCLTQDASDVNYLCPDLTHPSITSETCLKKVKVSSTLEEIKLPPSPGNKSLSSWNGSCITLGNPSYNTYNTIPHQTTSSDITLSTPDSPTLASHSETADNYFCCAPPHSITASKPKFSKRASQNSYSLTPNNSLKRTRYHAMRSSTSPSSRCRNPQLFQPNYPPPLTKRIGKKNYYIYTFPMPPSGPSQTSLFNQLSPKKSNYLQVLVKYNAESKDRLWTTLLQGALAERCVIDLCIAVGRMYLKADLMDRFGIDHDRKPWDIGKAVSIFNQYLMAGGTPLRKMVKFLIKKIRIDSISGRWKQKQWNKRLNSISIGL